MVGKTFDHLFKVLLIGDSGVGKTCIINRVVDGAFKDTWISTIGVDFKLYDVKVRGKTVRLQIWDTAGQERFRTITTSFYRSASAVVFVYDITHTPSFDNIASIWLPQVEEHAPDDIMRMLLGNKCDMKSSRRVSRERGEEVAVQYRIRFLETSAKENTNIEKAFYTIAEACLNNYEVRGPTAADSTIRPVADGCDESTSSWLSCCST